MALSADIFLTHRECFTSRNTQLPFHQIEGSDGLRHRMFHLQACIHFQKIKAAILRDEFYRTGALILHGLGSGHRGGTHGVPHFSTDARRGRFFNHLLVAALGRAITFKQMHRIAVAIAKHLHFNMARAFQIAFDQHAIITKGRCAFLPRGAQCFHEITRSAHNAHAAPATASNRLDHQRKANALCFSGEEIRILLSTVIAR